MIRHGFDTVSFTFGIVFVALAAAAALPIDFPDDLGAWIVPAAVLLLGVGIAISAFASTSPKER